MIVFSYALTFSIQLLFQPIFPVYLFIFLILPIPIFIYIYIFICFRLPYIQLIVKLFSSLHLLILCLLHSQNSSQNPLNLLQVLIYHICIKFMSNYFSDSFTITCFNELRMPETMHPKTLAEYIKDNSQLGLDPRIWRHIGTAFAFNCLGPHLMKYVKLLDWMVIYNMNLPKTFVDIFSSSFKICYQFGTKGEQQDLQVTFKMWKLKLSLEVIERIRIEAYHLTHVDLQKDLEQYSKMFIFKYLMKKNYSAGQIQKIFEFQPLRADKEENKWEPSNFVSKILHRIEKKKNIKMGISQGKHEEPVFQLDQLSGEQQTKQTNERLKCQTKEALVKNSKSDDICSPRQRDDKQQNLLSPGNIIFSTYIEFRKDYVHSCEICGMYFKEQRKWQNHENNHNIFKDKKSELQQKLAKRNKRRFSKQELTLEKWVQLRIIWKQQELSQPLIQPRSCHIEREQKKEIQVGGKQADLDPRQEKVQSPNSVETIEQVHNQSKGMSGSSLETEIKL